MVIRKSRETLEETARLGKPTRLSILMPVYNERDTVEKILVKVRAVDLGMEKEIVIVDDASVDGTREILQRLQEEDRNLKILYHECNQGKGAALRTGISALTGEYTVIQDADLEYDPEDYHRLLAPVLKGKAVVVYGSRFTGEHRDMFFWHMLGNKFLSLATNILYNTTLTDMETCYKLIRTDILKSFRIRCNRFDFEPEVSAKILKRKIRIYEVPISYTGREFSEGKKITWVDGFSALWALVRFRFTD